MTQPPIKGNQLKELLLQHPKVTPTISLIGNSLLIIVAVYSTFGAFISAFSFTVDTGALFLIWLLNAAAVSVLAMLYRGKGILLLVPPVLLLLMLRVTEIIEGAQWVLYRVTFLYSEWIPVTVLYPEIQELSDRLEVLIDPTVFIAAAGMVVTFLLAFAICMRRSVFFTILFTAPVVFTTFVITDYQSDVIYFFGLIVVYLTLLISSIYSQDDYFKRGLMFLPAFAIASILMLFAFMITPYGTYVRSYHASTLGNQFRYLSTQMTRFGNRWYTAPVGIAGNNSWLRIIDGVVWQFDTESIRIADAGGRIITDQSLLEITASEPGTFYLRGYSVQHFDGRSWSVSDTDIPQQLDEVMITWHSALADFYTPNNADNGLQVTPEREAMLRNRLEEVQRELAELSDEYSRIVISIQAFEEENPEAWPFYVSNVLSGDDWELFTRYETLLTTNEWIRNELGVYRNVRVDIAQTMPALIAELYATTRTYNAPRLVEMEINRIGDLTEDISYRPYYRGLFFEDNELLDNTEIFYYVEGSVHRLARYLPTIVTSGGAFTVIWPDDFDPFPDSDDEYAFDSQPEISSWYSHFSPNEEFEALRDVLSEYSVRIQNSGIYTQIDERAAHGLRQLALDAGIDLTSERAVVADAVADYIMASGSYTLMPGVIPEDEDFTLYFLQELQEGYCIHFATAAVMMLRSLDIPARFVSGYVATVMPNDVDRSVVLTDRNAHAWVEVFYEDAGWLYLEVTPFSESSFVPSPRPHNPEHRPDYTPPIQDILDEFDMPPDMPRPDTNNVGQLTESESFTSPSVARGLPSWVTDVWRTILLIALCVMILLIRRFILHKYRAKLFREKNTNVAAINIWRYIVRLSRHESVPATEIEAIALKAKFSQHRITEVERKRMIDYTQRLAYEIYSGKGGYGRFWFKYIRALY